MGQTNNGGLNEKALKIISQYQGPPLKIMEVCGTHTHEIFRLGLRKILPPAVELISGPGCPVCVTPVSFIDEAICLALEHGATIATFGDLVRVPGTEKSLAAARSDGAKIKIVYAPSDAVKYAAENKNEKVVFLAVGFETTTPSECIAVKNAAENGVKNFSLLTANKTMPSAYRLLKNDVDVYLYPGHVHAVIGTAVCEELVTENVSGVVAGFTATELLTAFAVILKQFPKGEPFFVNAYPKVVRREGSEAAQKIVAAMLDGCDTVWRGLGLVKNSGQRLKDAWQDYDARKIFQLAPTQSKENPACRCGEVLTGKIKPQDCPCFGKACTPEKPVGACMVSNEGTCSAYYQFGSNGGKNG